MNAPARGLALPLVLVLGASCHLMVGLLLDTVRGGVQDGAGLVHAARALADSESVLRQATTRLQSTLAFPATGCAAGLCANRQAPSPSSYDWARGSAHASAAGVSAGGYWIELLGTVPAGQSADCSGSAGGCEYVRVIASAAPDGVRRSLEACYRIRRSADAAPVVTRSSWRETAIP